MNKKQLSIDIIKQWLSDDDCDVRTAAMNACNGRDIPLDIIKQWLSDDDCCIVDLGGNNND